jgi:hypothetical protein
VSRFAGKTPWADKTGSHSRKTGSRPQKKFPKKKNLEKNLISVSQCSLYNILSARCPKKNSPHTRNRPTATATNTATAQTTETQAQTETDKPQTAHLRRYMNIVKRHSHTKQRRNKSRSIPQTC